VLKPLGALGGGDDDFLKSNLVVIFFAARDVAPYGRRLRIRSLIHLSHAKVLGRFLPPSVARVARRSIGGAGRRLHDRDGGRVQVFVGEAGAGEDFGENFIRTQRSDGSLGAQILDNLGAVENLEVIVFGDVLKRSPLYFWGYVGGFSDG